MQMIGIGPALGDAPTDLAGWKLDPAVIQALRSGGFDLGAFGQLQWTLVTATIEPSTDYASDSEALGLRTLPLGELALGRPFFWDDHGYFEVVALPDRSEPERLSAHFYTFRCSSMMRTAIGAPYARSTFPRRAKAEEVEPFLEGPPQTPEACLAWARAQLPCDDSDSLTEWLVVDEAPEWNDVFRWLAHCETENVGPCAVEFDRYGRQSVSSGLPEFADPGLSPGFIVAGHEWVVKGDGFDDDRVAIEAGTFLRSLLAATVLSRALEQADCRLDGALCKRVTEVWGAAGLRFEVFGRGLPF